MAISHFFSLLFTTVTRNCHRLGRYSGTVECPQYIFINLAFLFFLNWLLSVGLFDTICFKHAVCFAFAAAAVDDDQVRCGECRGLIC